MVSGGRAVRAAGRLTANAPLAAALLVGAGALALYARTVMPDVHIWDTAEFQAIGPVLGIAHPTGYPSYTLLAWLASVLLQPFGEPALRANLLSAILAAAAAGTVVGVVAVLTGRAVIGAAAGVALAAAPVAWAVGLRADAHALHLLLAAVLLALLVGWSARVPHDATADRWLVAAAAVYGIALGNHALTLLLAPGIGLFVLLVQPRIFWRRPGLVIVCAAVVALVTVALYSYLPLRSAMEPPLDYADPETLEGFRYLVFAEQFRGTFEAHPPPLEALVTIGRQTVEQLGLLAVLAGVGAVVAMLRRPALFVLLASWFGLTWIFALGYVNADIERYYLVPTLAAAVFGGLGAGAVWAAGRRLARRGPEGWPTTDGAGRAGAWGRLLGAGLAGLILIGSTLALVPQRFERIDQSEQRMGREWLEAVLPQLEQDAVVLSWWSFSTPLWYAQFVEGRRSDVDVIDDRTVLDRRLGDGMAVVERYLDERPVYVIRLAHELAAFRERFTLAALPGVPHSPVYRVDGRRR